jgi:acetyl esterase
MAVTALDPQVQAVLAHLARLELPPIDRIPAPEARRQYRETRAALRGRAPELALVTDLRAGEGPSAVPLRLYRPAEGVLPAFVFAHGGGWVVGDLDTHDAVCRELASQSGAIVVAIDYRLAPEHPFPAAVEDCWTATTWVVAHATELGIDPSRIAVGGDSAGGGMATVVALMAREAGSPAVAYQVLIYPVTDLRVESPSHVKHGEGPLLTSDLMRWYVAQYAPSREAVLDWRASPLLAPSLEGLPPALIITAGVDPLRDEGEAYAKRLEEAGVAVDYVCLGGMIHGFLTMGGKVEAANRAVAMVAAALRQALRRV